MTELGAVILAAGAGTRLGGVAKALLPSDGSTFLARIVATARSVGTEQLVVVVAPPFGDAIGEHARELGCTVVLNEHPERGMSSSVALGFAALDCATAWLWPVDHPDVDVSTLRTLIASLGSHAAVRPVCDGRGGHPPLIRRSVFPQLAACSGIEGGARTVLAMVSVQDIAVEDRGVVRDIDTPADLEARS